MYRKIEDFTENYKNLTQGTLKMFIKLSDKTMNQQVPGLLGPSKEEWTEFGMEPPSY